MPNPGRNGPSRRDVLRGAASGTAVIAIIVGTGVISTLGTRDPRRDLVHERLRAAGWTAQVDVFEVRIGDAQKLLTGPLPVYAGCLMTLVFSADGSGDYHVGDYLASDRKTPIGNNGDDGKPYPEELRKLRNPTRRQIDERLRKAGLRYCTVPGTPG